MSLVSIVTAATSPGNLRNHGQAERGVFQEQVPHQRLGNVGPQEGELRVRGSQAVHVVAGMRQGLQQQGNDLLLQEGNPHPAHLLGHRVLQTQMGRF